MIRRSNSDKWKAVLGFDEGLSPLHNSPKSYSEAPERILQDASTDPGYPRLPRDITLTRTTGRDFLLSPSRPPPSANDIKPLPDPPHLFYITNQQDPSPSSNPTSKPDIILHSGPSKSSPIFSFAKFHTVTLTTDITLCPPSPAPTSIGPIPPFPTHTASSSTSSTSTTSSRPQSPIINRNDIAKGPKFRTERLTPTGGIFTTEKHSFSHTLPRTCVREKFEWRYSSGPFVRSFEGIKEHGGMKLVRLSTGETVAVYAGTKKAGVARLVGMFRFLVEETDGLGVEFEILALVALLCVVERGRRAKVAEKKALGIN